MKSKNLLLALLLFLLAGYISCIKDFLPHIDKYNYLLVVDGAITDQPGPYTVRLSTATTILQDTPYQPYENCIVEINDNLGNTEKLKEVAPGIYKTDSSGIQGVVGRSYKIKIITSQHEIYESTEQELTKGIGIQTVYAEEQHKSPDSNHEYPIAGYRFYVDAANTTGHNYFLWQLECTYKFKTDWTIHDYYDGKNVTPFVPSDSLHTGYKTEPIYGIYALNTSEQVPHRVPLNFQDNYSKALIIRYSLKVNQYTLNMEEYTYWNAVKKMAANQGTLYDTQPFQVRGNIVNTSHPEKYALGYFMVAGMDEKRIFVDGLTTIFHFPVCVPDTNPGLCTDCFNPGFDYGYLPVYIVMDTRRGRYHVLDRACTDCRIEGVLAKPSFWVD